MCECEFYWKVKAGCLAAAPANKEVNDADPQ